MRLNTSTWGNVIMVRWISTSPHQVSCPTIIISNDIAITADMNGNSQSYVDLIFHSHDIEDAAPPMCKISWDYSYRVTSESNFQSSLLPGCYIADSREGFHMTYYWFYVLDWVYS